MMLTSLTEFRLSKAMTTRVPSFTRSGGALENAKIFLWTTNPTKETTRPDVALYYRQDERLANDLDIGMIDLYPVWLEALAGTRWRRLMSDKVHQTQHAYKQVALGPLMHAVSAGACD